MERGYSKAVFLLILLYIGISGAYNLKKYSWNWVESTPKEAYLWIHPNCTDPTAPEEEQMDAIQSAYNTWYFVGTNFNFTYGGQSTENYFNPHNNQNDMCWNPGSCPGHPRAGATTQVWVFVGNKESIAQADVVFWDGYWVWSTATTPDSDKVDVESVALHELGHVLGLGNVTNTIPVMYESLAVGQTKRNLASDDIDGMKAIYGLVVSIPNGSNTWNVGTLYSITWGHDGVSDSVNILLNRNYPNVSGWKKIYSITLNDGIQPWTPTVPPSDSCRVRVESANNTFVYDASDANFTVAGYTVTSPNDSGVVWRVDENRLITWTSLGVTGGVDILLIRNYPDVSRVDTLFSNTSNDGFQLWTVTSPVSWHCRMKVQNDNDDNNYDISDNDFRIAPPIR